MTVSRMRLQTRRFQKTAVATTATIVNTYSGGDANLDLTKATFNDIISGLSEMEKIDLPDPNFMSNYSTIIGRVHEVDVEPEKDVKISPHLTLWETTVSHEINSSMANN